MVKINQSGGSASAILVVVLLLLVIGGGGAAYYITQDESKAEEIDKKAKEKREAAKRRRKEAQERAAQLEAEEAAKCDDVDCGDNGECDGGACVCNEGWTGDKCDEAVVEEEEDFTFTISFDNSGREITPEPTPDETVGTCAETRELEPTIPKGLSEAQINEWRKKDDHISFYEYDEGGEKPVCASGINNPEWNACERDKWMNTRYNLPGNKHSWIQGAHFNWITLELPINDDLNIRDKSALEKWLDTQCKYPGSDGVDDFGFPIKNNTEFKECDQYTVNEIDNGECDNNPACYMPESDIDGQVDPVCRKRLKVKCSSDIFGENDDADADADDGDPGVTIGDINTDGVVIENDGGENYKVFQKVGEDENYSVVLSSDLNDTNIYVNGEPKKITVPDTGSLTNAEIYYGMEKGQKWSELKSGTGTHISRDYMNSYIKTDRNPGSNPMVDPGSNPRWVHLCDCSSGGNPFTNCLCKSGTYLNIEGETNGQCGKQHTLNSEESSEGYTCCLYGDDNPCHLSENQSQLNFSDVQGGGGINSLLNSLHIGDFYNFDNPFCNIKGGSGKVRGLVNPSSIDEKKEWINKCCPSCAYKRFKDVGIPNEKVSGQREKCGRDVYFKYIKKAAEELKTKYSKEKDEHERTKAQEWEYLTRYLKKQSGCFVEDSEAVICGDGVVREDLCYPCRSTKTEGRIPRNEKYNPTNKGCRSYFNSVGGRYVSNEEGTNCTPPPFEGPHLCPLVPNPSRIADGTCPENWVPTPSPEVLPKSLQRNVTDEPKLPTYDDIINRAIEMANESDNDKCEDTYTPSHNKYYGIEDETETSKVAYRDMGKLLPNKKGVIRDETEVPPNFNKDDGNFDDTYTDSPRFNYDAYNDRDSPTQTNDRKSTWCSNNAHATNWKFCKIPQQPKDEYTGGRLWPSNVFAEAQNHTSNTSLSGKWNAYSSSDPKNNKLTGGEIDHSVNYLSEGDEWLPSSVWEGGKYGWSLANFAGHNDIRSTCTNEHSNKRILAPRHEYTDCDVHLKNAGNSPWNHWGNNPTFGVIGIGYNRGGSRALHTTQNGGKASTGLNHVTEQMRIALRRRPWHSRFRNVSTGGGFNNEAYLPSGYNSRSPFYLMSSTNDESINHRGLLSSESEKFEGSTVSGKKVQPKERLDTLLPSGPDPNCQADQTTGCSNDSISSYEHIRNNMSQCQRTNFLSRNVDVPVARAIQTRKSYGNSLPYDGIAGTLTGATTTKGDGKDVKRPRAAPYTIQGPTSNFHGYGPKEKTISNNNMDNRVGANRPFKHQYYKMLSTKNGKPEGMWFRKNDYVLYDFQQRHNLTRLYGVGKQGGPRESPDFHHSNSASWHWDDYGYNWSGGPIHLDGVGNRALHQTLGKPRAYIETAIDGGQGDLPQTFAVSAYAKGTHGSGLYKWYLTSATNNKYNGECNLLGMWNGKQYHVGSGGQWSWDSTKNQESACYTVSRTENWYKNMSGKGVGHN